MRDSNVTPAFVFTAHSVASGCREIGDPLTNGLQFNMLVVSQ